MYPKILTEFFNNPHPGFHKKIEIPEDNIFKVNLPAITLNLNLNTEKILGDLINFNHNPILDRHNTYDLTPLACGWNVTDIWLNSPSTLYPYFSDWYYQKFYEMETLDTISKNITLYPNLINELKFMNVSRCRVSRLAPKGYLCPHRDIKKTETPMNYLWIPLDNIEYSKLGVYPIGSIELKLGNGYLLNQENFVHAVLNDSDQIRYAMVCELEDEQPQEFINLVLESIKEQYKYNLIPQILNDCDLPVIPYGEH